jgi:hypothetical protein
VWSALLLAESSKGHPDAGARPPLLGGIADVVFGGVAVGIARLEFVRRSSWVS